MSKTFARSLAAALLLYLADVCGASAANHLQFQPFASNPPDEIPPTTPRPRERGRKGMEVRFAVVDDFGVPTGGAFTINTAGATVTLSIVADACTPTINPPQGKCGYVATSKTAGNIDTVDVFFNDDLPASTSIEISVSGVVASGLTQEPNPAVVHFVTSGANPRTPVSLQMVFDISGSMGLPSVPAAATRRIDALKTASGFMLDQLPGHTMLGDKLGVTFFSTPPATGGVLLAAHDPANVTAVRTNVNGQVPTNSTSIGAGLNLANTAGFMGDSNPRKFVLLFSDGDQNTAPLIDQDAATCSAGVSLKVDHTPYPAGIAVCPITTGDLTACGYKLQQSIGVAACSGNYLHISSGSETFAQADANMFFTQALNSALVGDKLEIVREIRGAVAPGATQTELFRGNKGDLASTILIAWSKLPRGSERNPDFRLIAPDGTVVDTRALTRSRPGSSVTTLRFPLRQDNKFIDPQGQWKIELQGLSGSEVTPDYQIIVVTDNQSLASDARAVITDPGTGEPIPLEVKLTENGTPITGATVVASLLGPQNGLGDILAKAANPQGAPDLSGDLAGSAARAKLAKLLSDPAFAALLKDQSLPSVILTADAAGVYRGSFGGANKEGNYQFAIVEAGASTVGDFERTQRLTVFVRPKPDAAQTDLRVVSSTVQPDNSVLVKLRAIAKDRFGSMIGPDYGTAFNIRSSIGTIENPLQDTLDGGYDIGYRLPSTSADPIITVAVMGDEVKSLPLSALPGSSVAPSKNYFWWIIIALLILLALVLLILRRRHHHP
jgi:hypothetical protein